MKSEIMVIDSSESATSLVGGSGGGSSSSGTTPSSSNMLTSTNNNRTSSNHQLEQAQNQNQPIDPIDINEYVNWIDDMSRIGSLTIKETFLHDMYVRSNGGEEPTRGGGYKEKKWFDFVAKNNAKFSYPISIGRVNENGYLLRRFDEDNWRYYFYELMVNQLRVKSADCLWSIELIEFPVQKITMVREPEKLAGTLNNSRPRITVLFAFNANGEYIQPYFVFPKNMASLLSLEEKK